MKIKRGLLVSVFISGLFLTAIGSASVDADLHQFFEGLGYESNSTAPTSFQDQAAGYYSGGSVFLRNQVKNYQLISVELPSFSGGCSGIDAFLGSFSVISAEQLVKMMKNILSAGGAYAFDLALTTTVPQIKTVKDYLQKFMNDMNNANINSCSVAENLVGGTWPKLQNSQQQICRDLGSQNGIFSDWASARQGCGVDGQFDQGLSDGGKRKKEVIINKNLVWEALKNKGLTANDKELAETFMSLSGSFIIKKNGEKTQRTTLLSLANSQAIIKALLYGGEAEIYTCDEVNQCLNPDIGHLVTAPHNALVAQVTRMIQYLNQAVANDAGTVTPKIRGFLEMTPLPVLKYITNSLSLRKPVNPTELSDLIAISLLNQYLAENIQIIAEGLSQEDTPMAPEMTQQINQAQQRVSEKLTESYNQLANKNVLINNLRLEEEQLTSRLTSQTSVGQETR